MPKPTQVDESLFGKPARKTQRATLPTNSVVVSASELARIRERTIVRTVADESREREARQAEFEKKKVQARIDAEVAKHDEEAAVLVAERERQLAEKEVLSAAIARQRDEEANRFSRHEVKNSVLAAITQCDNLRKQHMRARGLDEMIVCS